MNASGVFEDEIHKRRTFAIISHPDAEDEAICKEAMDGCPVEAIGNDGEG